MDRFEVLEWVHGVVAAAVMGLWWGSVFYLVEPDVGVFIGWTLFLLTFGFIGMRLVLTQEKMRDRASQAVQGKTL